MTAKEKLRQRVETLTEEEAAEALRLLDRRAEDPRCETLGERLRRAVTR